MPKLTATRQAERRRQILDGARAVIAQQGLQAVTMETIIAASGLSTGAVYRYYRNKDEIVVEAILTSLKEFATTVMARVDAESNDPLEFLHTITDIADRSDIDLLRVLMHGWSLALGDLQLRTITTATHARLRDRMAATARHWRATGIVDPSSDDAGLARLLYALMLGSIAQRALIGDAAPPAHTRDIAALLTLAS